MIEKKFSKPTQSSVYASFLAADSCLNPAAIFVKTGSYWLLHVPSFVDFDMLAVKKNIKKNIWSWIVQQGGGISS